jgi:hypothetical protein
MLAYIVAAKREGSRSMKRSMRRLLCAIAVTAGAGLMLGVPSVARADVYNLTAQNCTNCGAGTYGTITVTSSTVNNGTQTQLSINVAMTSPILLHQSQGSNASPGLYFDLSSTSGLTFSSISGPAGVTWTTSTGGSPGLDAFGTGNVAINCASTLSGKTCGSSLVFTVTGSLGLSLASFSGNNGLGPVFFVADVNAPNGTLGYLWR